ncbi:hypothetical protein AVEN_36179-1 [Araneus ventricosus]|uniref:Mutator-like transposase domain-containing protein n=2 Tax=Araneus ventricosus TaxID=182803 RepID=A0A4Y2PIL4_ARAVE|nr:hypothetical protein AVEN_36179-1 [Araneus ventricosus]
MENYRFFDVLNQNTMLVILCYVGDGDSNAFNTIIEKNVYGDQCSVTKLECIGHVMKRMGTRLRRLRAKMRGQKLSDDENPQHGFCPSDPDTWCKFKKAELLGSSFHNLPVAVVEAMGPIFKDLSHPDLLKKCLHGSTQNPNESVNNVIWTRVPKKTFVHIEVLSLGTYDATSTFNIGNVTKLQILKKLNIEPGDYTIQAMKQLDNERLIKVKYANLQKTKEVRKEKKKT